MFSGGSGRGASSSQILDMIHDYNSNMRRMIYLLETTETRVSTNHRNPLFTIDATSILTSLFDGYMPHYNGNLTRRRFRITHKSMWTCV